MKRKAIILMCAVTALSPRAFAASSQNDIYSALSKTLSYAESSAMPRSAAGSFASDYYIMALSRAGRDYDYGSYANLTESISPGTKGDGQRLIMASAACGVKLDDSFVGLFTYNSELDSAADLAGAIITVESCGYTTEADALNSVDYMVGSLLNMQQTDGSFANDVTTTAKSLIALSYHSGQNYNVEGKNDGESYEYSVSDTMDKAVTYLSGAQSSSGGYSTVSETAYVVTALNSAGIDADTDGRFSKDGTPVTALINLVSDDGSVNGSDDDTALTAMALTSQLREMQGKAQFFDFTDDGGITIPAAADTNTPLPAASAGTVVSEGATPSPAPDSVPTATAAVTMPAVININPYETKSPEHSSVSEEDYGPFQFVGPLRQDDGTGGGSENGGERRSSSAAAVIVITVIGLAAAAVAAAFAIIRKKKPEWLDTVAQRFGLGGGTSAGAPNPDIETKPQNDLLDAIDKPAEIVPEEELYDPDFIKKLIPVDELSESVDGLIPPEYNEDTSDYQFGTDDTTTGDAE